MLKYILTICFCVVVVSGNLPSYIRPCSCTDPKLLDKCATKSAIAAWPLLVRGDEKYGIQTMDPLFFPFLRFDINKDFDGNMTNGVIVGLSEMEINEVNLNLEKKIMDIYFVVPRLYLLGPYKCAGEMAGIEMDGEGNFNLTWTDMECHLHLEYKLEKKRGKHYVEITENSLKYETTRQYYYLTNLFNGDKERGDKTNREINEKWEPLYEIIEDKVGENFGNVYAKALQTLFNAVSFDDLFTTKNRFHSYEDEM